ncbi:MAG: hypothetical protein N2234_08870, partial [Planctomycetota bacterium]|nr:hypothetical protein [Planctomycetota bacterium]
DVYKRQVGVPVVMVAQMGGVQSAWVPVEYTLVDSDSTAVSIVVKYSADGIDFHDATEAVSDPDTGKVSSGTNNLAASAAGVTLALSGALLQMSESECSTQHILR